MSNVRKYADTRHNSYDINGPNDNLDKLLDEFDARLSSLENKLALTSLESKLAQNPSSMPAVPANVISLKAGLGVAEKFLNAALTLGAPSLNMKMSYGNAAMQLRDLAGLGLFGEWSSRLHLMASVLEDAAKEKVVNEVH